MTTTAAPTTAGPVSVRRIGLLRTALKSGRTKVGLVLAGVPVLFALIGPFFAPHSTTEFVATPFSGPSGDALFGTDNLGRDVLSRFLHGGLTLLMLAVLATALGIIVGTIIGVVAGYTRGWLDETLMRLSDVALAFPQIVLALLFLSIIGPKLWLLVLIVGGSHAPRVARVVRGATQSVVERDFIKSAEAIGLARWRLMFTELMPNVTGTLMVETGLRLTYSIGLVAGLGFLGLGLQPPTADWGLMINENRIALTVQPWPVVLPVIAIALLTVGTNLVADGIARTSSGVDRGVEA